MREKKWLLVAIFSVAMTINPIHASAADHTQMKQIVADLFEVAWNNGDFSRLDQVWHKSVTFHFRGSSSNVGIEGLQNNITFWRTGFPDFTFTVHQIVAEGDTVAARVSFTGTHIGKFGDLEPTHKRVAVSEMMFFRFEDNKVIEAWEDYDELGMLRQLGALD